jgi:DNA-binding response OmpR family regulator
VEPARTVLVVDDEPTVRDVVGQYLARDGFRVVSTGDGREVTGLVERESPHLVVLDVMLPGIGGLELCRAIRARWPIPVILLTARSEESDRIVGLELGADDYVTKPFSPRELLARVRAVTRRGRLGDADGAQVLRAGDLEIDRQRFEVKMKGRLVELTRKEFDLLATLIRTPGRVFGREELLDLVWGQDGFVEPRTVDVHVARLRAKFTAARAPMPAIETVRGVGYRFRDSGRSDS